MQPFLYGLLLGCLILVVCVVMATVTIWALNRMHRLLN